MAQVVLRHWVKNPVPKTKTNMQTTAQFKCDTSFLELFCNFLKTSIFSRQKKTTSNIKPLNSSYSLEFAISGKFSCLQKSMQSCL
jgi:hypothetical protein